MFLVPHGPTLAPGCPTVVTADRIKHIHFHLQIHSLPLCSQSIQPFQPLATQAEVWQAIPGVSEWVMAVIRRGYTLQFARRPPRFRCVLATTVRSKGTVPGHSYRLSSFDAYGSSFASTSVSASHVTNPVLAEAEGSIRGLASRTSNGDSGMCISPGPWERPLLAKAMCDLRHGAQKEGCHDRRFQQGLGSAVRRQTDLRSLVREGVGPAHQLPRNASSVLVLSILLAGHTGTPCASTLRQQVRGVIHKSLPHLEATLHVGEQPSCVGSDQSALTEGDACAGQDEPWSRHVVKEQRFLRGMDAPPAHGSENLGSLWQSSIRPLCLRRQISQPNLFHKEHGCPGPQLA